MDPDLQLDPNKPPKLCPQCARTGIKSKVKKFKLDPSSTEVVIMCKNGQVTISTVLCIIPSLVFYISVSVAILSAVPSRCNSVSSSSSNHQSFTTISRETVNRGEVNTL